MQELGCVTAINLDGGGSTILGAQYPGESQYSTINQPSDGKQRKCANFIFLTMDTESADETELLHLYPYDAIALRTARFPLRPRRPTANTGPARRRTV